MNAKSGRRQQQSQQRNEAHKVEHPSPELSLKPSKIGQSSQDLSLDVLREEAAANSDREPSNDKDKADPGPECAPLGGRGMEGAFRLCLLFRNDTLLTAQYKS